MKIALISVLLLGLAACTNEPKSPSKLILISANAEWAVVKRHYQSLATVLSSPVGDYFETEITTSRKLEKVIFFHGGWGKVSAAATAQYCIDRWNPDYIINMGACGGFEGLINRYDVILANKTVIYDIHEAMGDSKEAIDDYSSTIDLSWLPKKHPLAVTTTLLVSADQDIIPSEIPRLKSQYMAIAGDWESGAIAWVCAKNGQRLLILKGVSDLVNTTGGEAYGHPEVFIHGTDTVMNRLIKALPDWLDQCQ